MLEVSASGSSAWLTLAGRARGQEDARLTTEMHRTHVLARGTYGAPRVQAELVATGTRVSRKRLAGLMRTAGLRGVSWRKRMVTTVLEPNARPAPDLVQRQFTAAGRDQLWDPDITYIRTWSGLLYLAVGLEAWSRRVAGWGMETHLRAVLVLAALEMAVRQRHPRAVIHHSDQGTQYTALAFGQRCREAGVRPSMGSVGDCYDNALCERFFATLECGLLDRASFRTPADARAAVFDFIEGRYDTRRRHSAFRYASPLAFELPDLWTHRMRP